MDEGSYTETGIPKEVMGPIDNWVTDKSLCGCTGEPRGQAKFLGCFSWDCVDWSSVGSRRQIQKGNVAKVYLTEKQPSWLNICLILASKANSIILRVSPVTMNFMRDWKFW